MPAAPRTARATARAELTESILDHARAQLAEVGPAAISLRAVTRDLGMTSSAVYRYFESRDALLTALLLEAYDQVAEAVDATESGVRRTDLRKRWRAVANAVRDWAWEHPHQYALAFGSPVSGYAVPDDAAEQALRVPGVVLRIVDDVKGAKALRISAAERAAVKPATGLAEPAVSPASAVRGLTAWSSLLGAISLELSGQLSGVVLDLDAHFATVVDVLAGDLGLV